MLVVSIAARPAAPSHGGTAPTIPAWMLAKPFCQLFVCEENEANCPSGVELWQPMQAVVYSCTWPGTSTGVTPSSPIAKPLRAVTPVGVQYTIVPGASTGAMPIAPLAPRASPVRAAPPSTPPRTVTVIGTSSESTRSASHMATGIVHSDAAV